MQPIPFKSLEDVVKYLEIQVIETNILHYGANPGRLGPNVMAIIRVQAESIWHYQQVMEGLIKELARE